MVYSLMYVRQIAVYTIGSADEKAIYDYIKHFDASSPKCIADEKKFLASKGMDKKLSEQRQRFRDENYFIDTFIMDFYRKDLYRILFSDKNKNVNKLAYDYITKNIENWIKSAISEEEEPVREGTVYTDPVTDFKGKYGVNVNTDGMISAIQDIACQSHGKRIMFEQYYKVVFQALYSQTDRKNVDLASFAKDYENVISSIRVAETGKDMIPKLDSSYEYGGMGGEKLQSFLLDIKKEECNYSLQARQSACGVKDEDIATHYKNQILDKLKEDCSDKEKLAVSMANLNAMKEHYGSKSVMYKITSFLRAKKEANEIAEMQKLLVEKFGADKVVEYSVEKEIFSEDCQEQKEHIQKMCGQMIEEQKAEWLVMDEDNTFRRVSVSAEKTAKVFDKQASNDAPQIGSDRK